MLYFPVMVTMLEHCMKILASTAAPRPSHFSLSQTCLKNIPVLGLTCKYYHTDRNNKLLKSKSYVLGNKQFASTVNTNVKRRPRLGFCQFHNYKHSETISVSTPNSNITPKLFGQQSRHLWDLYRRFNFGNYELLDKLGEVSDIRQVPSTIQCPPYAITGQPSPGPDNPEVKSETQIDCMRKSCYLARSILNALGDNIQVGMTTDDIDIFVHEKVISLGAYPSPLNYHGFPKSVCTSVNNVCCHGIPNDRKLIDGDIISVDVTVYYNGFHGDCCETYLIGNVDDLGVKLVDAARRCRDEAINICGPGVPFSAIGTKIEETAKDEGVTNVPAFIGHGIGEYFHGPPDIYHIYNDYPGTMEPGMTFTVEPILAQGSEQVVILEDGWTAVMLDNGRAAQFEHTILITEEGHEILTKY